MAMLHHLLFSLLAGAALMQLVLANPLDSASLPAGCPPAGSQPTIMPGTLPNSTAYLDYVLAETGQRVQFYYNQSLGLAAQLVRNSASDTAGPDEYQLYDHAHGQDVSHMLNWPTGRCNVSNATGLSDSLAEIRNTVFLNSSASPCLLLLLAPELADAHNHSGKGGQPLSTLAWENNTACFNGTKAHDGQVWRVKIQLFGDAKADVSSVTFELLSPPTKENATSWTVSERRTYRFLASQRGAPPPGAISALANPPSFVACGAARERDSRPPAVPNSMLKNLRLATTDKSSALVVEDCAASALELAPQIGARLRQFYGPNRLRLVADRALAGVEFVQDLEAGNCSLDWVDKSALGGPLPFNLSADGWLWTGESAEFQGRQGCRRYLRLAANSLIDYEVYFCGGTNFTNLGGYSRRRRHGSNHSAVEVANYLVTEIDSATERPIEYDLTACALLPGGGGAKRLLMRVLAAYHVVANSKPADLTALVRSTVTKATGISPLRLAQISVAKDVNASLSQVWLTLLGPPTNASSSAGAAKPLTLDASLKKLLLAASASGLDFKVGDWPVASLELGSNATDTAGRGGGGGGGGGSTVYIHDGHSGGAMAALAFFMLLLGGGGGVLGAWCVWKRRPNMPYYVQD
ncbi:hypothetical protein BOX15_Mlig000542g1 [Macrostomum lignano]|uniref:Uncharacterized protein n=1 Tax=Macrostomum lignano TaxID=282301 RepID=A0A267ESM9_9PLAT|nr:hypothetical protein BOX15_Mlig000542g1 [Macrostomum lignano]